MCGVKVTMWAHRDRADCGIKFPTPINGFYIVLKISSPITKKEEDFEVIIYIYIRIQLGFSQ